MDYTIDEETKFNLFAILGSIGLIILIIVIIVAIVRCFCKKKNKEQDLPPQNFNQEAKTENGNVSTNHLNNSPY